MRLNAFLARAGIASRRGADEQIKALSTVSIEVIEIVSVVKAVLTAAFLAMPFRRAPMNVSK
jgi:16S rRNA U516 pseudouridylate synthase RsuA-like enzyme